ncbi:MAG: hypothetical protein OEY52_12500 [Gammaproteobacteria bacterium]|nr:hypothetical protein [Gammaproteobacteria bacterium]
MEYINLLKKALLATAFAGLVACGGGSSSSNSSDSSPTYSGKTEQAVITEDNAEEMLDASIDGASAGSQAANLTSNDSGDNQKKARLAGIASKLKNMAKAATEQLNSNGDSAQVVSADEVKQSDCEGVVGQSVTTGSFDTDSGAFNASVQYTNFCHSEETDGATMDGSISMTGFFDWEKEIFDFKLSFTNLTAKDETDSMTMNGKISMAGSDDSFNVSMTFDFKDNNSNKVFRVEDYKLTVNEYGTYPDGHFTADISGKTYHTDYGSYSIETIELINVNYSDEYPNAGIIKLSGNKSSVTAHFMPDGKYILYIDNNGDGVTDVTKDCDVNNGECGEIVAEF